MTPTVCFVDNETTGLDRDHREVWECALIRPEAGGWAEYVWQLPVDLSKADPKSLEMNGFHERRRPLHESTRVNDERTVQGRAYQTPLPHFARRFAELTRGLTLVAANVGFDEGDLWKILRANGECPMWHYHVIDVEALAAGWLASSTGLGGRVAPDAYRPPYKHTDLVRALGIDPDSFERHTALGDARMAKATYEAVMG